MQNDSQKGMLGSRFENFNAVPSTGLWDAISSELDEKKKRRGVIWWWIGTGIAAIGLILLLLNLEHNPTDFAAKWNATAPQSSHTNTGKIKPFFVQNKQVDEALVSPHDKNQEEPIQVNTEIKTKVKGEGVKSLGEANLTENQLKEGTIKLSYTTTVDVARMTNAEPQMIALNPTVVSLPPIDVVKNHEQYWEIGVGLTSWKGIGVDAYKWTNESLVDSGASLDLATESSIIYTTNRPLGLNFHAGYRINDRLRLISGVNIEYTRFKRVYKQTNSYDLSAEQNVDFLSYSLVGAGVPIGITYDLFKIDKAKRLRFGVGLTLLNEFVFAERATALYDANYVGPLETNTGWIKGYNFGLNSTVYGSYYLTEKIKIQVNPGMRYYPLYRSNASVSLPQRKVYLGGTAQLIWEL